MIAIASDHAGFGLKAVIIGDLEAAGHTVLDLGTYNESSVDYPDYGEALAEAIANGRAGRGVLICGTGIGISIAANRHPVVRAAVCHNVETARLSRAHNDANVLALGARVLDEATARSCVRAFLETPFDDAGRHARRVAKLGSV